VPWPHPDRVGHTLSPTHLLNVYAVFCLRSCYFFSFLVQRSYTWISYCCFFLFPPRRPPRSGRDSRPWGAREQLFLARPRVAKQLSHLLGLLSTTRPVGFSRHSESGPRWPNFVPSTRRQPNGFPSADFLKLASCKSFNLRRFKTVNLTYVLPFLLPSQVSSDLFLVFLTDRLWAPRLTA